MFLDSNLSDNKDVSNIKNNAESQHGRTRASDDKVKEHIIVRGNG